MLTMSYINNWSWQSSCWSTSAWRWSAGCRSWTLTLPKYQDTGMPDSSLSVSALHTHVFHSYRIWRDVFFRTPSLTTPHKTPGGKKSSKCVSMTFNVCFYVFILIKPILYISLGKSTMREGKVHPLAKLPWGKSDIRIVMQGKVNNVVLFANTRATHSIA